MNPLPKMQILSLYQIKIDNNVTPAQRLPVIVDNYNKGLDKEDHYKEIEIESANWNKLEVCHFQIKWWISVRKIKLSGASRSLQALAKNKIELGTSTEHHLIFLYRNKVKTIAKKVWECFALTTHDGNYPIRQVVDYSFPLKLARRVCLPVILNENTIPIGGDYLAVGGEYKKEHHIAYSSLESLSQITKTFQSALDPLGSLYKTKPFKQFKQNQMKVNVGEMYFRFNHSFSLDEHAQICDQISTILESNKVNSAFEYFDHIRKIPPEDVKLVAELETALIKKVFHAYSQGLATFEFYHHHTQDYSDATKYGLKDKKEIASWTIRPSADEILKTLQNHLKVKTLIEFINRIKKMTFYFQSPRTKGPSVYPLLKLFKGEIFYKESQYIHLNGWWCKVEGDFYSFIQNEFLRIMKPVFLKPNQGALPLAWVSKEEWTQVSLDDLNQNIINQLKCKKKGDKYVITKDPALFSDNLKKKLGDEWVKTLSTYYARFCNYCEKEENYNRKYLFDTYNKNKHFGADQGYLVFDQVYPSKQQKIELFDIARYSKAGLLLYHVKEQLGQKTRDACSQIRTAADAIAKALEIGGKSDVLTLLYDRITQNQAQSPFQKKVKAQVLSFGKKAFLNIFKRDKNEITFVYAFLDDAADERDLGEELERTYPLKTTDFKEMCTQYKGEKTLTGKQILDGLCKEGFLDAHYRIKDQFIGLNKPDDFSPTFLGTRKKNKDAIFKVLQSHLSQFNSFIAKKELINTKHYIENLGFNFRICQIYRDGTPSGKLHFESVASLNDKDDDIPNWKDVFELEENAYQILETSGGGSCALHALNGKEDKDGVITFCNSHLAAKQDFVKKLGSKMQVVKIKNLLKTLFETLLKEYWKGTDESELVFDMLITAKSKKERDQKFQEKRDLVEKRAKAFWSYFNGLNKDWQKKYLNILKKKGDISAVTANWNDLYAALGTNGKKAVDPIQKQIDALDKIIGNWEMNYVNQNFNSIWNQYKTAVLDGSYYLSEIEIELAAYVYNKKNVWVVARYKEDIVSARKEPYNPEDGHDDHVIFHEGVHYSQCKKAT